jgi:hypothetical protein
MQEEHARQLTNCLANLQSAYLRMTPVVVKNIIYFYLLLKALQQSYPLFPFSFINYNITGPYYLTRRTQNTAKIIIKRATTNRLDFCIFESISLSSSSCHHQGLGEMLSYGSKAGDEGC